MGYLSQLVASVETRDLRASQLSCDHKGLCIFCPVSITQAFFQVVHSFDRLCQRTSSLLWILGTPVYLCLQAWVVLRRNGIRGGYARQGQSQASTRIRVSI